MATFICLVIIALVIVACTSAALISADDARVMRIPARAPRPTVNQPPRV